MKLLSFALLVAGVSGQCNEDEHHPENGGYFFIGAAGMSSEVDLDSAHGQKLPNNTWVQGLEYPYGQNRVCVGPNCRAPCNTEPGCPHVMSTHTCSILKFCPPEATNASQAVYLMPDEVAMNACNFAGATEVGRTLQETGSCVEYAFEEDHELKDYFFSSPEGCATGQKLKVEIGDFTQTAAQCKAIGNGSSRIRKCDCRFDITPSTLGEPCRTAFSDQCDFMTQKVGDCCEQGNCLSKLEDINDPLGKEAEMKRQEECDDDIPGLCYNEDGKGTDTNRQGSINCCTRTCKECGIEDNPFALWKKCTSGDPSNSTANCGFLSRYDQAAHVCDFSQCEEGDHWHPSGDAFKKFFQIANDPDSKPDIPDVDTSKPDTDTSKPDTDTSKPDTDTSKPGGDSKPDDSKPDGSEDPADSAPVAKTLFGIAMLTFAALF